MTQFKNESTDFKEFEELVNKFLISYVSRDVSKTDEEWLKEIFAENLPDASEEKICELCREVQDGVEFMKNFLAEAEQSRNFSLKSQNWFYEKIKKSVSEGDEEFLLKLCSQNALLENINRQSQEIFHDFNLAHHHFSEEDDENLSEQNFSEHFDAVEKSAPAASSVRKDALNSGVKKSIMTQYQRIMNVDMAQINFRINDMAHIAMNLSRNAALTGICGMMLTSGLSMLKGGLSRTQMARPAIKTGAVDGFKFALTGALKAGVEKKILPVLTRTTPMIALTAAALIAVESSRLMFQYARGEIKCLEAFNQISKISTAALCAITFGIQGALIGATTFAAVPVTGAFIGEMVGNAIGYSVGQTVHSKIKLLVINAKNILSANYGIFEHLLQKVSIKNKLQKSVKLNI